MMRSGEIKDSGHLREYEGFLRHLRRHAEGTIWDMRCSLRNWFGWLQKVGIEPVAVKLPDIEEWLACLRGQGRSAAGIGKMLSHVRGYYEYLMRTQRISRNPADGMGYAMRIVQPNFRS
jgi:site-specific recombinase XerD